MLVSPGEEKLREKFFLELPLGVDSDQLKAGLVIDSLKKKQLEKVSSLHKHTF